MADSVLLGWPPSTPAPGSALPPGRAPPSMPPPPLPVVLFPGGAEEGRRLTSLGRAATPAAWTGRRGARRPHREARVRLPGWFGPGLVGRCSGARCSGGRAAPWARPLRRGPRRRGGHRRARARREGRRERRDQRGDRRQRRARWGAPLPVAAPAAPPREAGVNALVLDGVAVSGGGGEAGVGPRVAVGATADAKRLARLPCAAIAGPPGRSATDIVTAGGGVQVGTCCWMSAVFAA